MKDQSFTLRDFLIGVGEQVQGNTIRVTRLSKKRVNGVTRIRMEADLFPLDDPKSDLAQKADD